MNTGSILGTKGKYYQVQTFPIITGLNYPVSKKNTNYGIIHRYVYFLCYKFTSINTENIGRRIALSF
jgi:hypothetical protein